MISGWVMFRVAGHGFIFLCHRAQASKCWIYNRKKRPGRQPRLYVILIKWFFVFFGFSYFFFSFRDQREKFIFIWKNHGKKCGPTWDWSAPEPSVYIDLCVMMEMWNRNRNNIRFVFKNHDFWDGKNCWV